MAIWTASDVAAHGSEDGTPTTEIVAASIRTKRFGDEFGSVLNSRYTTLVGGLLFTNHEDPTTSSAAEAAGELNLQASQGSGGVPRPIGVVTNGKISDGQDLEVVAGMNDYFLAEGSGGFANRGGISIRKDPPNHMDIHREDRNRSVSKKKHRLQRYVGGVLDEPGQVDAALDTAWKYKMVRVGATSLWRAYVDRLDGNGFILIAGTTQDFAADMDVVLWVAVQDGTDASIDFDRWEQVEGDLYWDNATVTLANKAVGPGTVDFSTFDVVNETGVVLYDYAVNGGAFTGILRTKAQIQVLPPVPGVSQMQWKAEFNGGGETAASGFDALCIAVGGGATGALALTGAG